MVAISLAPSTSLSNPPPSNAPGPMSVTVIIDTRNLSMQATNQPTVQRYLQHLTLEGTSPKELERIAKAILELGVTNRSLSIKTVINFCWEGGEGSLTPFACFMLNLEEKTVTLTEDRS